MVEWPNVTPVQHFCSGFDHACISCKFLLWIQILTRKPDKIRFCNVYYLLYEHIKRLFEYMMIFSTVRGGLGIGHVFRTDGNRCFL